MNSQSSPQLLRSPFEIDVPFRDPIRKAMFSVLKKPVERVFRLRKLSNMYREVAHCGEGRAFTENALQLLNINYQIDDEDLERIPREGPVIVVANHPFGAIEGLMVGSLLTSVREDVKIMANYILGRIPQIRPLLIQVDPFGGRQAMARNRKPMKEAIEWVKAGHMLEIFPAGEVSHFNLKSREISDPLWNRSLAKFIRRTEAAVLPVYFEGTNSALFQIMGLLHPRLRTVMLPHEMLRKSNSKITIRVGKLIPFNKLAEIEKNDDLMDYIRFRTYLQANRKHENKPARKISLPKVIMSDIPGKEQPIAPAVASDKLHREIDSLPAEAELVRNGDYVVYRVRKNDAPDLMNEIGRLREISFREEGEGTGKACDIDVFDDYYTQLFVWNAVKKEIVGGYRLGKTDEILNESGTRGLYTSTLFRYKKELLEQINPSIELGRSFVRPEYQREFAPLHLLWKGIGHIVADNPKYKMLFGPVSINNRYKSASRQILVSFLQANNFEVELAQLVKPKTPLKVKGFKSWKEHLTSRLVTSLDEVSSLISEIESNRRGVPILLRHYLKLGGKLLGFNIDPDFSDVLDGLILVDLTKTPPRIMERYLGKEQAKKFFEYHKKTTPTKRTHRQITRSRELYNAAL